MGTADFRSIKFHVYEASLTDGDGDGARLLANADAHFRASMAADRVWMNLISRCRLGQIPLKAGERIEDRFALLLLPGH